ncbi:MAG: phosphoenolpyruvate--protein phosphotransferase [Hyphomicrobiales bacterium]|nr:phosphoenolpyruvate--protein phosphotransferase [Hyphomicrobiales bacterium]
MAVSLGAPRVLLRRLREIMAKPESAQARLDRIVVQIAANMVAEVCSVYVSRRDGSLELFATEGLNPEAVHKTHLKRGEGLVGLIVEQAEPLNLPEAQDHPAFSYRPETGEEIYHSFLGVPILRGGHALGVLTVQNQAQRHYSEEEVEALQTTAMVLAELIASGELTVAGDLGGRASRDGTRRIACESLSEGLALGHAVLHEPRVVVTKLIAEDTGRERVRLGESIEQLRTTIDDMLARVDMARAGEHRDVLEAYRMFAHDRGWIRRMEEAVSTGLTAEAAVERVQNDTRARMLRQTDPFLRERLHDIDDLSNRLLRLLAGRTMTAAQEDLPEDAILIARTMGPAELLDYDRQRLRGLVLEESGSASHVAIVARALDLAAVGQATGIVERVDTGDAVVLDAEVGEVYVRPTPDVVDAYADKVRFRAKRQEQYDKLHDTPAVTTDGVEIEMQINSGLLVDLPHLEESGASGIGLFRTELQFMISSTFPRLDQQTETYRAILDAAGERPVVFRSLDIGGDKVLPYIRRTQEENPALGWRAIRMALDRPGLLRTQVRALMRAAAGRELRLMLPMVSEVSEYDAARDVIDKERAHLRQHGREEPERILIGAMIEVPALLWQLDRLLPRVDFVSVGSNDLLQFLFAADRSNRRVADRFDVLSRPVLRVLRDIVVAAGRANTPLTLCGEMAGRPLEAMALIGLGFRCISMAPASIGPVKAMILSLDAAKLTEKVEGLLEADEADIRGALTSYAEATGVQL